MTDITAAELAEAIETARIWLAVPPPDDDELAKLPTFIARALLALAAEHQQLLDATILGPLKGKTAAEEIAALRAERDAMRAVVEAAARWRDAKWNSGVRRVVSSNLRTALDSYRAKVQR